MRRRRAFPGYGPEIESRYERAGHWLLATIYAREESIRWCNEKGVKILNGDRKPWNFRAQGEDINQAGGFLVPLELSNAIYDLRDQYGAFRRRARIENMASDRKDVPRRPGGTSAFFAAENSAAQQSPVTMDMLTLTAKKLMTLVLISTELEEDSLSSMVDFVANEIAFAFSQKEDDCAFNGDGTSGFGGCVGLTKLAGDANHSVAKIAAASSHNTFLGLDSTDLGKLVAGVQAAALPNSAWFCSVTCFGQTFTRLAGGTGFIPIVEIDGVATPIYLGFPVIFTQKLPLVSTSLAGSAMLAFGDMYQGAVLGQRRRITIARSDDRYLEFDQIGVLGTERIHPMIHDIGDNTNPGMLAVLFGTT